MQAGLGPDGHRAMAQSFNDFVRKPELESLVQSAQQEELEAALKLQEKQQWRAFKDKVEAAGPEVLQALEPFLRHSVLRRLVMTFSNGEGQAAGLAAWALNPRVQAMLHRAKQLLDEGTVTGPELEHLMVQQLQSPLAAASQEFKEKSQPVAVLSADQLVGALNEHLAERRKAKAAWQRGDHSAARHAFQRALAVLNIVRGTSPQDNDEIALNKAATLLDCARLELAVQQPGAALDHCNQALQLTGPDAQLLVCRAEAHMARREYKAVEADLREASQLSPDCCDEVEEMRASMATMRQRDKVADSRQFKGFLTKAR
ncbi:peptidyl-prolyl cis-trans isomerase D, partial [Haematococcus lacustris]